jgi:osmoprotectant transport system permease protein
VKRATLLLLALCAAAQAEPLKVGSKRFTESYILGEVMVQAAGDAVHRQGLGNTGIVFAALKSGAIDLYSEYTGTLAREILQLQGNPPLDELRRALAPQGLGVGITLGFNNSYALAMREERARALGIARLSDLARHPGLRLGLSHEFIGRADGWAGLRAAYGLAQVVPQGLDHGLAYEALAAGKVDLMDVYTTDAKIERYGLRVLDDDRGYFPRYDAVLLYRLDVPRRHAAQWEGLRRLEGRITAQAMRRMNAAAEIDGRSFTEAAALLEGAPAPRAAAREFLPLLAGADFWRLTIEHLLLVFGSLAASVAVGVPLGIAAAKRRRLAQPIFAAVGVIQTIPSLALLAFLIATMGRIGTLPALLALFLYALLPIVRNTHAGLEGIRKGMREASLALGLTVGQRLRLIELPLAMPSILAGIKTSAIINVGTATIAAFVGAGGYGERIVAGLALNDSALLLAGAVPAAALALLVQGAFELGERRVRWIARPPREGG